MSQTGTATMTVDRARAQLPKRQNSISERKAVLDHPRIASYAFAFDIDGVLVKGPETIPGAPLALQMLNGKNKYNITIPYIFVTNGGGKTEELRCEDLSNRLGVPVKPHQFIQGHTPMKSLVEKFGTVLVVGGVGEACRTVAKSYGFRDIVTPGDILKWNPSVSPFRTLTDEEVSNSVTRDFSKIPIEAILVFADSREWAADQQIILDLLMSKNGVMGTVSPTRDEGPPIFFAHSDFVWATNYSINRYGMGALQVSIAALYEAHAGKPLTKVTKFGKPNQETFQYANKVLTDWRQQTYETQFGSDSQENIDMMASQNTTKEQLDQEQQGDLNNDEIETCREILDVLPAASTVYFVGDTPESDIRFANTFDKTWHSILVKTGVYQDGTEPAYKPKTIVNNVLEAVEFAIEREHQKELAFFNQAVDAGVEVPVDNIDHLHPHILAGAIERYEAITPVESPPAEGAPLTEK